ncbi:hypothetical protein V501_01265, partial [Pseudogymnoascus sp. VKM F-4519 (FW-2642)]
MRRLLQHFQPVLQGDSKAKIETIKAFMHPPNRPMNGINFVIKEDRELAGIEAERTSLAIFTDGSARNGLIGVGATWQSSELRLTGAHHHFEHVVQEDDWTGCWETISSTADNNGYAAELLAILKALQTLNTVATQRRPQEITILSDCKSALISIQKPRYQSGQYILKRIWRVATQLRKQGTYITLQWTPAHEGVIGNEKAHKWAETATKKNAQPAG